MIGKLFKRINNNTIILQGSLSMIGTVIIKSIDLISIPIFTRILDTGTYGKFSVFTIYMQILLVILSLDMHSSVSRAILEFKSDKKKYFSNTLLVSFSWTIFFLVACNIFSHEVSQLLSLNRIEFNILIIYSYMYSVINYKSCELVYEMKYKKNIILGVSAALGNMLLSIILIFTLFSENKFFGRVLGASIPIVMIATVFLIKYFIEGKSFFDKKYIIYGLKYGVPLIPSTLSFIALGSSDRIMIKSMIGISESGIYSLTYSLGLMMQVVTEGANNVWCPKLFRRLEEGKRILIKRQAKSYLLLYTIIAIVLITISPEMIKIFSGKAYWGGTKMVMWIALSTYFMFIYTLYVNIEFYHKKTALISMGTLLAAILNIVLNFWGLPRYGYMFAAISTVVAYGILILFHSFIVNKVVKDNVLDNGFIYSVTFFVVLLTFVMGTFYSRLLIRLLAMVVSELIMCILLITEIRKNEEYYK